MKAAVRERYGAPDVVHLVDVDRPVPNSHHPILRVRGAMRPTIIDRRFPLTEVVAALRHVDDGHARGKVVISVGGPHYRGQEPPRR
ncbi:MAG: zinc-binding dehydrogenase [Chloroflexi bacterium]|nr:zinc-binding dehydrogenase [Chloroflexota bacterium]